MKLTHTHAHTHTYTSHHITHCKSRRYYITLYQSCCPWVLVLVFDFLVFVLVLNPQILVLVLQTVLFASLTITALQFVCAFHWPLLESDNGWPRTLEFQSRSSFCRSNKTSMASSAGTKTGLSEMIANAELTLDNCQYKLYESIYTHVSLLHVPVLSGRWRRRPLASNHTLCGQCNSGPMRYSQNNRLISLRTTEIKLKWNWNETETKLKQNSIKTVLFQPKQPWNVF